MIYNAYSKEILAIDNVNFLLYRLSIRLKKMACTVDKIFCTNLRTGALIIAIIQIISGCVFFAAYYLPYYFGVIAGLCILVAGICLLFAWLTYDFRLAMAHFILTLIAVILDVIAVVLIFIWLIDWNKHYVDGYGYGYGFGRGWWYWWIFWFIVWIVIYLYFTICGYSYYVALKSGRIRKGHR